MGDKVANYRTYGKEPFNLITLHGGPGAIGELQELSEKLAEKYGVIEYLQKLAGINDLIDEMSQVIKNEMESPVKVIGFSWGAWLGLLFTERYPKLVESLTLISCAPLEEKHSKDIKKNRLKRMNDKEKELFFKVQDKFKEGKNVKIKLLNKFVELMHKVDAYSYVENNGNNHTDFHIELFKKIWAEASLLRKEGQLVEALKNIDCPLNIIHGAYDPHPYQGILEPVERYDKEYELRLLEKCGHTPWREKYAEDKFYKALFELLE